MTVERNAAACTASGTTSGESAPAWVGRCVLVYGWGRSGRAVSRLLARHGCSVLVADDQRLPDLDSEFENGGAVRALSAADLDSLPSTVELVVPSPGVPMDRPLLRSAAQRGVPILGELEIAFAVARDEVVAITGSNGKSTTTELTGALLRGAGLEAAVCGNIGVPLSDCVESPQEDPQRRRVFVVEVSSFQLESVERFRPRVAALLNLSDDHLDRHGSFESYARVKRQIFARQGSGDVAVLNGDDRHVCGTELPPEVRRRLFSRLESVVDGAELRAVGDDRIVVLQPGSKEVVRLSELMLQGEHNVENVLAACAIADAYLEGQQATFSSALVEFRGLPHRLQQVESRGGVSWFDDSKGTNVGATLKSLEGFADGSVHLILGGRAKGGDFRPLLPAVRRKAARLYLIGEARARLADELAAAEVESEDCVTLERAVRSAAARVSIGDVVLLSPAWASFDQFRDYAHRGEVFAELVATVVQNVAASTAGEGRRKSDG